MADKQLEKSPLLLLLLLRESHRETFRGVSCNSHGTPQQTTRTLIHGWVSIPV
jgi:hypothetical protein